MIGFNHIGNLGRLGNQMFEYAALRGIAKRHGYDFMIPPPENKGIENYSLHECFKLSPKRNEGVMDPCEYVTEPHFHFSKNLFETVKDNVSLYGFFQSWKYFHNIEDEIKEDFTFHNDILEPCKEMVSGIENPIALHIRRGDYIINSENHFNLPIEYYEAALKHFDDDRNVIVFSDDPLWCHDESTFADDRFIISENEDNRVDLCLMSLCNDFIIANSTYSWWGAWLSSNKDKKVIAPVQWFGTGYTKDHNTKDVTPDDWTRITG